MLHSKVSIFFSILLFLTNLKLHFGLIDIAIDISVIMEADCRFDISTTPTDWMKSDLLETNLLRS